MKSLQLKHLKDLLVFYGAIIFEFIEMAMSIAIAKHLPNIFGTVAIVLVILLSIELNTGNPKNPYIKQHRKIFSILFFFSALVCVCALLFILVINGPHTMLQESHIK